MDYLMRYIFTYFHTFILRYEDALKNFNLALSLPGSGVKRYRYI